MSAEPSEFIFPGCSLFRFQFIWFRQTLNVMPDGTKLLVCVGVEVLFELCREPVFRETDHLGVDVIPRWVEHEPLVGIASESIADIGEIDSHVDFCVLVTTRLEIPNGVTLPTVQSSLQS